jgi:hypothetical protein
MEALTNLSPLTQGILSIIGIVFVGVNTWDKLFSKRAKMLSTTDDRLIGLLKATVDEQEKRIGQLETDHKENTKLISRLEGENSALKAILQGRDGDTIKMREQVASMAAQMEQSLTITRSTLEVATRNSDHTEKLLMMLGKHFDIEEANV